MCGIAAAFHFGKRKSEDVNHFIMEQYQDQFARGQEGFGFIRIGPLKQPIEIYRSTEPVKATVDLYLNPTKMGIFHHRSPTSTINDISQTHPIIVSNDSLEYTYAVIHNGSIVNAEALYAKHQEQKFEYTTYYETHYPYKTSTRVEKAIGKFNDSESLAIELVKFIEGKTEKIEAYGKLAFIVLQCTKDWLPVAIHFGRNEDKPLNIEIGESELYLSSEGAGEDVVPNKLFSAKINTKLFEITEKPLPMASAPAPIASSYYPGHTTYSYCRAPKCLLPRIGGKEYCEDHGKVEITILKQGTSTDPRQLCVKPGCHKLQRIELGIKYCKIHKELAREDTTDPKMKEIGKTWDCRELGGEMCYDCQHENTNNDAIQSKLPMGFKTNTERALLENVPTRTATPEEKDEDPTESGWPEDAVGEHTSDIIESLIDEYMEAIGQERLPDYNEYGSIIEKLLEAEYGKVEKRLLEANETPTLWRAEVGPKIQEAEMYLAYMEDMEADRINEQIKNKNAEEKTEAELIEIHQNANYF